MSFSICSFEVFVCAAASGGQQRRRKGHGERRDQHCHQKAHEAKRPKFVHAINLSTAETRRNIVRPRSQK